MTAYLPKQVKLFAGGAIYSQAMQVSKGYTDGHKGEWMRDPEFFARSIRVYWDLGYQMHIHVNGDAGLDLFSISSCIHVASSPHRPSHCDRAFRRLPT